MSATALFLIGALAERSATGGHREPAAAQEAGHREGEPAARGEAAPATTESRRSESERVLGVDVESTPLLLLAAVAGLGLAALALAARDPRVMGSIAVAALAWAVLDLREVAHQLDESRGGIAAVAVVVAVLHASVAIVAVRIARDGTLGTSRLRQVSTQ